jgi:mRNA interferase MazF
MVLLLSWDAGLGIRDRVTVAPLTTRVRHLDTEVELTPRDGLPRDCVVNLDLLTTVRVAELDQRVTHLSLAKLTELSRAAHYALGMPLPCAVR